MSCLTRMAWCCRCPKVKKATPQGGFFYLIVLKIIKPQISQGFELVPFT